MLTAWGREHATRRISRRSEEQRGQGSAEESDASRGLSLRAGDHGRGDRRRGRRGLGRANGSDRLTLTAVKKAIDAPADLVLLALGWLAREDKLAIDASGKSATISLK